MRTNPSQSLKQSKIKPHLSRATVLAIAGLAAMPVGAALTNVTYHTEVAVKETLDSNVYLQDNKPNPANVAAAEAAGLHPVSASKSSLVTSLMPKIGLDYKPCDAFNFSAAYAPEFTWYHSASSEDYTTHRGTFNFAGAFDKTSWELLNTATYIDGSKIGPTFARPDDIPAIGGIPLRDRRAAFIFRNGFRLTQEVGKWFFRPVATAYIHDFKTDLRPNLNSTVYSYENYIDRQDISGGLDVGYEVAEKTYLVAGYRYGHQDQFKGPFGPGGAIVNSPFGNDYHRILLGIEGNPASWLKLAVLGGPDIRQFGSGTPKGFDRTGLRYYWDASATVIPTTNDTVTIKSTRYEQPAFSSFSMYEDVKTDLAWRHRFDDKFSAQVGFTLYVGDWEKPVTRDDWIYTPNVSLAYAITKDLGAEFTYSYDWVDSKIPASVEPLTNSHEFTRHLASLAVKYSF